MTRGIFAIFLLLLTACSTPLHVNVLPNQTVDSRQFAVVQLPHQQQSLLVVQFQPEQWRWVQTDPLGAPIARLTLSQAGWQNDGFVMPNTQAKLLFSAIATYLHPDTPLFSFRRIVRLPAGTVYSLDGRIWWEIQPLPDGAKIQLSDDSTWFIKMLKQE